MHLEIIPCLNDNYSYLIKDDQTNKVAIIDPSEFDPCDKKINQKYKKLDFILNTHHHFDHIGGNTELKNKYGSKVLGFEDDQKRIPGIDILLKDDKEFKIGDLNFKTIFIPGHTIGHVAFYFEQEKIIFTGDTLFSLGCGRVFEGTHEEMFRSLNKIKNLPPDTKIYCGHEYTNSNLNFCLEYDPKNTHLKDKKIDIEKKLNSNQPTIPSTVADEIKTNIFLRCDDPELKRGLGLKDSSDVEVFSKLRDLKDSF